MEEAKPHTCSIDMADIAGARADDAATDQTPPAGRLGRPHRGIPDNFAERWVRVGWFGAPDEFGAHTRSIGRWLDECGRDEMILARKRYLDAQRTIAGRARRKRYVMGRTLEAGDRGE